MKTTQRFSRRKRVGKLELYRWNTTGAQNPNVLESSTWTQCIICERLNHSIRGFRVHGQAVIELEPWYTSSVANQQDSCLVC